MVFCEGGSIFKVHPRDRHGSPLKRDGGIDHLDAIHGGLVDQHDHPTWRFVPQDHRQYALGQAGSIKVLTFEEPREPFIAAFKLLALGRTRAMEVRCSPP